MSGNATALRRMVVNFLKLRGFTIDSAASDALISVLAREGDPDGSLRLIFEEIKERFDRSEEKCSTINVRTIESVVADLSSNEDDLAQESLQLFDAFTGPKLQYDEKVRQYKIVMEHKYRILAPADARANMYRERLLLTQQRLLRSDVVTLRTRNKDESKYELSTVESLLGSTGAKILLGYLTQPLEGEWCLEDLTGIIRLDLSAAQTYHVLYTEGSLVIAQGQRNHLNIFVVTVLAMPPVEDRATTLRALNMVDTFGPQDNNNSQHHFQMQQLEQQATDQRVIILSDMHLDKPLVLEKFLKMLQGFDGAGFTPLYVLIGSFLSQPLFYTAGGKEAISKAFQALAETICKVPNQKENAKFLLVPGPLDAGSNVALPRRSLPAILTTALVEAVPHVSFGSNPCRLRCFTQEIVIFREDLMKKMQRNLALPMTVPQSTGIAEEKDDDELISDETHLEDHQLSQPTVRSGAQASAAVDVPDVLEQMVESICSQAHLAPLSAVAAPVLWELDHALRLLPLPDILVLADHTDQFSYELKGCHVINPGTFASDFSFITYTPKDKRIEYSRVP